MSAEGAFVRSWRVGRYTATLSAPLTRTGEARAAVIEWAPTLPRRLTEGELAQYRAGRDAAIRALAAKLRGAVAVVEV